jgi:uncharacterized protein (TIGR02271 family)
VDIDGILKLQEEMKMTNTMNPQSLVDAEVFDPSGDKIGKVGEVYLREDSHQPAWITVKSGLFNHKETLVPLQGAQVDSDGIRVAATKERIKDAPQVDADGRLSEQDSAELYRYYGIQPEVPQSRGPVDSPAPGRQQRRGAPGPTGARGDAARGDRPEGMRGDLTDQQRTEGRGRNSQNRQADQDTEMVRSEERLNVGTEQVESGRVRLRKYVVTEQQQVTVPVSHEEARIERVPINESERGSIRPGQLGEAEEEMILREERPVVNTEAVAVERIRLGKQTVTEEQTVGGEVRKEQVELDESGRAGQQRRDGRTDRDDRDRPNRRS